MIKVIELFAGIGSQRQALKEAKIEHEIVAISEIDKYAISACEKLHGPTLNLGDISKIERLPQSDMWTYSFPCFLWQEEWVDLKKGVILIVHYYGRCND